MKSSLFRLCLIKRSTLLYLLGFLMLGCSQQEQAPLTIEQLHIMQIPPGQSTAAAYMTLKNNTDKTLVLNYVHSPIAADVEVHRVIYDQGMMQMRQVQHLSIDPGKTLNFEPGGYHLMLMGIEQAPAAGETFDISLEFENGYAIVGKAEVRSLH